MIDFIAKITNRLSLLQGFGYGTSSIEKELKSSQQFIPKKGGVFIDVGGNIGDYTNKILEIYRPKEVHVFEPSPTNIKKLIQRFDNNKYVTVNGFGLSNVSENTVLYSNLKGSGLGSLTKRRLDHFGIDFNEKENIKVQRFDQYWNKEEKIIDLFKIDVEGHEMNVLEGLGDLISSIKIIQFEFGGCNIDTRTYFQDFYYFFKKHNFDIYRITPFHPILIKKYSENYERFTTTNYFCVNKSLV